MKRLWLVLLMVLIAGEGWGATYYVKPGSANPATKIQYKSAASSCADASGWTDNSTVNTAIGLAGAGGTVNVCAGTYNPTMTNGALNFQANNVTIQGVGTVIFAWDATASIVANIAYTGDLIKGVTLSGASASNKYPIQAGAGSITVDSCVIDSNVYAMTVANGGTLTVKNSTISNNTDVSAAMGSFSGTGSTVNLHYNQFINNAGALRSYASNTVNLYNNDFIDNQRSSIQTYSGAIYNLSNNRFFANGQLANDFYTINNVTGGTVTDNTNLILSNIRSGLTYRGTTGIIGGSGDIYTSPKIVSPKKEGMVALIIDDYMSSFPTVADYAETKGFRITFSASQLGDNYTSDQQDTIALYANRGHDIAVHGWTHTALANPGNPITFATTATHPHLDISIDQSSNSSANWNGNITIGDDGGANTVIPINGTTRMDNVVTQIQSRTGWSGSASTGGIIQTQAKSLAAVTNQTTFPYAASLNQSKFWYVECAESKKFWENIISTNPNYTLGTYTVTTFIPPGNDTNATLLAWLMDDANFAAAGTTAYKIVRGAGNETTDSSDLSNLAMNKILVYQAQEAVGGATGAAIPANIAALTQWLAYNGRVIAIYQHQFSDYSQANWQSIIDALAADGSVSVLTMRGIYNRISGSGLWATADAGVTYTRTFTDASNYRLRADSTLLTAGTDLCSSMPGATDYSGRVVCVGTAMTPTGAKPSIGAYQAPYVRSLGGGYLGQ